MLRKIILFFAVLSFAGTASAATLKGLVKYDGEVPNLREIKMDADPVCLGFHKDKVFPQVLVLGDNQEMAYVFVHVVSGITNKNFMAPTEPVVLDQKGCMYEPHVFGVMVGQPVKILNPDGTLHNVHAMPKINEEFNMAMPKFRTEVTKTFDKPEFMFPIKCDVHPWMVTWASVMTHPYYSVTKADGLYAINDLPPGEYTIEAWHEKLGTKRENITVTDASETIELNFNFSKPQ